MSNPPISDRIRAAAIKLLDFFASEDSAAPVRLFGSAAVALSCPHYSYLWDTVSRGDIGDIDIVTSANYRHSIRKILTRHGLVEDYGSILYDALYQRLLFNWPSTPYTVEVFFDPLDLHHKIELGARLTSEPDTISLADLLMTKLQFEDLETRSAQLIDLCIILAEHKVVPNGSHGISANRIEALTTKDWGLWHTARKGLILIRTFATQEIIEKEAQLRILRNVESLQNLMNSSSRTPRWKAQALAHKLAPCLKSGKPVYEPSDDPWANWTRGEQHASNG